MGTPGHLSHLLSVKYNRPSCHVLPDVMYGVEPMTREIAMVVRYLRIERKLSYSDVGWVLCERGADPAVCFQIGQSFSTLAATFLKERPQDGWL